jgi:hypothetical protein
MRQRFIPPFSNCFLLNKLIAPTIARLPLALFAARRLQWMVQTACDLFRLRMEIGEIIAASSIYGSLELQCT